MTQPGSSGPGLARLDAREIDWIEQGRSLGRDVLQLTRWPEDSNWPEPILEGFHHAQGSGQARRHSPYEVRKWVQLRLGAYGRNRLVDSRVTPAMLKFIDVVECPVLREPLTRGELRDTDASIDRVNNLGAYAMGNLIVMSVRANRAKGAKTFDEVLARAHAATDSEGLAPLQWLRLAALMVGPCFADRPGEAPDLPMPVPMPNGTARMTSQQVQFIFAVMGKTQRGKNRVLRLFLPLCPDESARWRLRDLAEEAHERLKTCQPVWDIWLGDRIMDLLKYWRDTMGEGRWAALGDRCIQIIGGEASSGSSLAGWRLDSEGDR